MIKKFFGFLIFLLNLVLVAAEAQEVGVGIEFRAAAFFPSSHLFREIYGNVDVCYELEANTPLCGCFDGWVNFDWLSKHSKAVECEDCSSRASIANVSFGIKYPYYCCNLFTAYVGIGPNFSRIWLKNKSHCGRERRTKFAIGGVLKTGVLYCINQYLYIDLFVDYLYQPVHFKKHVNIGGFKTGAGIGIKL